VLHVGEVQLTGMAGIAGADSAWRRQHTRCVRAVGAMAQGASTMEHWRRLDAERKSEPAVPGGPMEPRVWTTAGRGPGKTRSSAGRLTADRVRPSAAGGTNYPAGFFGGGPIGGRGQHQQAQSIREFNHKNHYDKWQFSL